MKTWRGDSEQGHPIVISFGPWDIHVSPLPMGLYTWNISGAWGFISSGIAETLEQAQMDSINTFIERVRAWQNEAIEARNNLGGAAAKE